MIKDVDSVVVERALRGWKVQTNHAEKVEITQRWQESGRSLRQLALIQGWKPERYTQKVS